MYFAVLVAVHHIAAFPLDCASEFRLPRSVGLSNESLGGWLKDQGKSLVLEYPDRRSSGRGASPDHGMASVRLVVDFRCSRNGIRNFYGPGYACPDRPAFFQV